MLITVKNDIGVIVYVADQILDYGFGIIDYPKNLLKNLFIFVLDINKLTIWLLL